MTTLDIVTREGGKPANFLDIGGGASAETVREGLTIVLMDPNVKGVLFNIFGGITRGDEVAQGMLEATGKMDIKVPMVVRMAGTRAEEGLKLLEGSPLVPAAVQLRRPGRSSTSSTASRRPSARGRGAACGNVAASGK